MTPLIFDRPAIRQKRDKAAAELFRHDFLYQEVAERLADRLMDIKRRFPLALDLGSRTGHMRRALAPLNKIDTLVACDISGKMLQSNDTPLKAVVDEEALPFAAESFDLVICNLSLHLVNDLPGSLIQIRRILKPDGLFIATLFGSETLRELRQCFIEAEAELHDGISPRIAPFIEVRDAGALLQRAGFTLPVSDADSLTFLYPDAFALMRELKGLGESNPLVARRKSLTHPRLLLKTAGKYLESYGMADQENRVPATFEIISLTGWSPHESQQKPLAPGSGQVSLKDFLE